MSTLPYAKGHQVDQELRKLEDISSTLDKALSDAMQLENRSSELERLIQLAHHEAHWMASAEDEWLNAFV